MAILQRGSRFNDGKLIASQEYVDDHSNKKNNPHSVTKSQVGLGSVQNYGIATKAEAESGSANNKYITPLRAKEAISKLETIGVSLVLDSQVIEYDLRGLNPSPNTTQLQANVYGNSEADTGLFFQFFSRLGAATAWTSMGVASSSKTANISAPSQMSQLPLRYKVEVRRGSASGTIIATDYVELVGKTAQAIAGTNVTISGNTISAVNTVYSNATTSSSGLMSSTDKSKLNGIATGANNYTHPSSHPASMITETSTKRFVTDADKSKLDGIETGANKYTHPSSHPASMITESSTKRFVTDAEKSTWNSKQNALAAGSNVTISGDTISAINTTYGVATASSNGLMASGDKSKLDGIASGANKYSHPSSHPASMITESTSRRFVSDSEKSTWNAKASTSTATTSANGLMSSSDKSKLNGIATGAQVNRTIATQAQAEAGTDNSRDMTPLRTKQAIEKLAPTPPLASTSVNGLMASTDKVKLDGIATGANNYTHPSSHPASMITPSSSRRFVTDSEKSTWNAKQNALTAGSNVTISGNTISAVNTTYGVATTSANGLMAAADKSKLNGIAAGANKYTHPSTHPYSMITGTPTSLPANGGSATSAKHLLGDDTRSVNSNPSVYMSSGSRWGGRAGWQTEFKSVSTLGATSVMSGSYCYLQTHTPWSDSSGGYPIQIIYGASSPSWRVGVSTTAWSAWTKFADGGNASTVNGRTVLSNVPANAKFTDTNTTYGVATTSSNGLMSSGDKSKLNGIATGANKYTHPSSHPASMITESSTKRFVSDTEKATWNGKQNSLTAGSNITISGNTISATNTKYGAATTGANGLMSAADKSKLNGIATGANNYTHPSSHPASMITPSSSRRFVTDAQISSWNAKPSNLDTITNQRTGSQLKYWVGTQAQYDAIGTKDSNTIYDITQ